MMLALSLTMMLSACASSTSRGRADAGVALPPLPAHLDQPCPDAAIAAGANAKAVLARTRVALGACRRQQMATARFYNGVRHRFGGKTGG